MILMKSVCSHCGQPFGVDSAENIYSIITIQEPFKVEIITGELIPEALHYCSDNCMFERRQGIITFDRFIDHNVLNDCYSSPNK